jgi:hypothetical protein
MKEAVALSSIAALGLAAWTGLTRLGGSKQSSELPVF